MRWKLVLLILPFVVLACLARDVRHGQRVPPDRPAQPPPAWLEPYDRASYRHWIDADHDCQDTRQEVLIAESLVPVRFADGTRCKVASGRWRCPYTGRVFEDPKRIDVDHLVPLRHAHEHGGREWSRAKRRAYANELGNPDHLVAVSAHANRAKGHRGPEAWRPANERAWCWYGAAWQRVKTRWKLRTSAAETAALGQLAERCRPPRAAPMEH